MSHQHTKTRRTRRLLPHDVIYSVRRQQVYSMNNCQYSSIELGFPDVGFAHGVVQTFLSGLVLYQETECPKYFSIFCFYEKLCDALDNKRRLLMHLKSKYGKAKSNEEINESFCQVVFAPSNFTKMISNSLQIGRAVGSC